MKKKISLMAVAPVLMLSLGCESTNQIPENELGTNRTSISDSGFVKFDPSSMDSTPQKKKKVVRVINRSERFKEIKDNF